MGLKSEIRTIDSDYIVLENDFQRQSMTNFFDYFEQIFGTYF